LGVIHSLLLRDVRKWLDEKASETNHKPFFLYDIRNKVESSVMRVVKSKHGRPQDQPYSCLAFPVGVNKNSMAAHYSPRDWES